VTETPKSSGKKKGSGEEPPAPKGKPVFTRRWIVKAVVVAAVGGGGGGTVLAGVFADDRRSESPPGPDPTSTATLNPAPPLAGRLVADNALPDGRMPEEDAVLRMINTRLEPDQYGLVGVRHVNDRKNGTYLYPCTAATASDLIYRNVKLGSDVKSKGPWTVTGLVVDQQGKAILDAKGGRPFLDDLRELLNPHLLRYYTMPLSR
jgi:hypothetical protein